jgi:hypothetical protein
MASRILRYELPIGLLEAGLPMATGPILAVGIKPTAVDRIQLWATGAITGDGQVVTRTRHFHVLATGSMVPEGPATYLGTVVTPVSEVWHVWEVTP